MWKLPTSGSAAFARNPQSHESDRSWRREVNHLDAIGVDSLDEAAPVGTYILIPG